MARSLEVKQEESPRASLLFLTFVALCAGVLAMTWFSGDNAPLEPLPVQAGAAVLD